METQGCKHLVFREVQFVHHREIMYLQGKEDDYAKPKVAYKLVQDIVKQDLIKKASVPLGLEYSMDIVLMDFDEFIRLKECERRLKELQPQSSPKKGDDPDA